MEVWKFIPGFGGAYEASSEGRIRETGGRVRKLTNTGRYTSIRIWGKTYLAHRLVLAAFHGEPPPGMQCRHLNGVKTDNRVSNLAWGTGHQNQMDRFDHGTACEGENNYRAAHSADDAVRVARMKGRKTPSEIANETGLSLSFVKHVIYGRSWNWVTGFPRNRSRSSRQEVAPITNMFAVQE